MRIFRLLSISLYIAVITAKECLAAPFSIGAREESIPENGTVTYTVVKTDQNEFSFLPPPGWRAEVDKKRNTLTWTSPDYRSMVRLKISDTDGDTTPNLKLAELRQLISEQNEDSKIIEESPCYTSGLAGLAFDTERATEGKFVVNSRIAFIPVTGGYAQVVLTSPKEEFRTRQTDLSRYLNSFRVTKLKPK